MNERDFQEQVDALFATVEDRVDEHELDVDIDSSSGLVTVTFPDDSSVILSRQPAASEVWVAARSGGFHLAAAGNAWNCAATGETFGVLLDRVFSEQLGEPCNCFSDL